MGPSGTTRRGLLAACATATVPMAGCSDRLSGAMASPLEVSTDWPRVQYDARATGRTVDVTGPTTEPSVRWTTDVEAVEGGTPAVVVADGTVFVASGSVVAALDAADGTERWNFTTEGRVESSAAVVNGTIYFGSLASVLANTNVYALDAASGAKLWNYTLDYTVTSQAVLNGAVYFGSRNGDVYALTEEFGTANFTVVDVASNSPVTEGEPLRLSATIENTGTATASQTVSLSVGGTQRNATTVTLGPRETATVLPTKYRKELYWYPSTYEYGTTEYRHRRQPKGSVETSGERPRP
jgi:outer membrane protein assembly factor BamB